MIHKSQVSDVDNVKLALSSYHTLANGPRTRGQYSCAVEHLHRGVWE